MAFAGTSRRVASCATAMALVLSGAAAAMTLSAPDASAASGTLLFSQPFNDNTVDGPAGSVSLPGTQSGANAACLTAAGNSLANPLASCPTATDVQGSGTLRLTPASTSTVGAAFAGTSVPTTQGLDVTFDSYQYGGDGADGMSFVLAAVDPADPQTPALVGPPGGSLGYADGRSRNGLPDGYLGVGFDAYGGYSNSSVDGSGCTDPAFIPNTTIPGQVVVRGPGNGTVGYCGLASTATNASSPALALRASTRSASVVPVEVVINPASSPVTTASGLVVPGGDYDVTFTPAGGTTPISLTGALPAAPAGLYPASWVDANGIPKQLAFGWVGSTGGGVDNHEISDATASTLNPVPLLAVSQTSYAGSPPPPGSPVTYQVAASSSGPTEDSPVTVTETVPSGVVPVGASGPGWGCGAPSGQQISCTDSTSPFAGGTVTVNGIVTSGSMTATVIEAATALASSDDGDPGTSSSAPEETLPTAPAVTGLSPSSGPAMGNYDVTVTGSNLSGATAIEVGTPEEFAAGTPATLNLCASPAPGCFTVTSDTSLDISSMPAHASGAVTVEVVSLGIAGTAAYTYTGPALFSSPTLPGGEVSAAYSDQLTVTGGTSPYTWSVSDGSLPDGITLDPASGALSGTPTTAGSYSFTVAVTDSTGMTATQLVSLTIIPGPPVTSPAPPEGELYAYYDYFLTATGGTGDYSWSVSSGSLPSGLDLYPWGEIYGLPDTPGSYAFTIQVTDTAGGVASEPVTLVIADDPTLNFAAPPLGQVNAAYSDDLSVGLAGGVSPYTWYLVDGDLPPGISLSTDGVLEGTPTSTGTFDFTVEVADANYVTADEETSITVDSGPVLDFPPPDAGQDGVPYSATLTASGGQVPYAWSLSAGSLPAGITLDPASGVLSGTPTGAGTYDFTVLVTDANGLTATQAVSLVIAPSVALSVSAASVNFGQPVTLTATVSASDSGSVEFDDTLSSGPQSGQTVNLGTVTVSGGTATVTTALPALGTNTITAVQSSGSSSYASAPATVQVTAYAGEVIISQFRLSGPGGAADQYAVLYNAGPAISLAGFTLAASSGTSVTVPSSAPVLASGGTYLITGADYSLGDVAASDLPVASLGTAGLQLSAPDGLSTVTDAVGSAAAGAGFYSGTPLPALSGTPASQYAWVRLGKAGVPVNTASNLADFQLVSTTGAVVGGVQSCLGSPSPQDSGSPAGANADFRSALLDPAKPVTYPPNFVYVRGTPGRLTIRRTVTNTSSATITSAQIRITALSEANGPPEPGVSTQPPVPAQLRVIDPATPTSLVTITGGQAVTVQNLSVDPPADVYGDGGLGTTLTIPLPDGSLAPGASVSIALTFAVDRHGPYWFGYDVDAVTASGPDRQSQARRLAARPSRLSYATGSGTLR
jgi:hypothetical protein